MRILLVSSDPTSRHQVHQALSRHNFTVDGATQGKEARELLQAFMFDMVVLDSVLPELDEIALCRHLRDIGNPLLILLMVDPSDAGVCVQGLDSGADACIEKPIREPELLAHIRALARRTSRRASLALSWGPLSLDPVAQQITCCGRILKASRKEYQILELFLSNPRQMFSRSEIGDRLWSLDEQLPTDATIKSHIRSIRRKLGQIDGTEDLIQTHYGHGYCLNPAYSPGNPTSKGKTSQPEITTDSVTANLWREAMAANARLRQEIEQRKQVETQLYRSEMMLRSAQRVAQIGCWKFDLRTRENFWTEELYRIHGLNPSFPPPQAHEVLRLIYPDDLPLHKEAVYDPAKRGEVFEANLRIIRANDGEVRYINARGGPIWDSSGKIVQLTGAAFDVTQWIVDGAFPPLK